MGGQDCKITAGCKGHLAGMTSEITLIFKTDSISKPSFWLPRLFTTINLFGGPLLGAHTDLGIQHWTRSSYTLYEPYFKHLFVLDGECLFSRLTGRMLITNTELLPCHYVQQGLGSHSHRCSNSRRKRWSLHWGTWGKSEARGKIISTDREVGRKI